jgi:type I restriction enzyme S subunit
MTGSAWKTITVKNLADAGEADIKTGPFGTQLHASDYVEHGTPVINVRNIGFGSIRPEKLEYIDDATVQRLSSHLLQSGDIVFGRKGAVERHVLIRDAQSAWFQGSDCIRLRISGQTALPTYVSYCLLTEAHKQWMINQGSHGATMASLNQDIILRIPIKLPDLPIQRRIASILSAYDDLVENNTRRSAVLEEMVRRLYQEWFVHFRFPGHEQAEMVKTEIGLLPAGWRPTKLGATASDVRDGIQPSAVSPDTPYVGLEHLPRRSIALSDWGRADEVQSLKLTFQKGDILFGKIRPYFHKVSVAPINGVCSSDAIVIRSKTASMHLLVLGCVSSDAFVAHATQTSNGTKMPRANWDVLAKYPLPTPTDEIIESFNSIIEPMVTMIANLTAKNRNLRATRDLLLPKLLSGEIDVSTLPDPDAVTTNDQDAELRLPALEACV